MQSFGGQADMALFCALVPIALRPAVSGGLPFLIEDAGKSHADEPIPALCPTGPMDSAGRTAVSGGLRWAVDTAFPPLTKLYPDRRRRAGDNGRQAFQPTVSCSVSSIL